MGVNFNYFYHSWLHYCTEHRWFHMDFVRCASSTTFYWYCSNVFYLFGLHWTQWNYFYCKNTENPKFFSSFPQEILLCNSCFVTPYYMLRPLFIQFLFRISSVKFWMNNFRHNFVFANFDILLDLMDLMYLRDPYKLISFIKLQKVLIFRFLLK